MLSATLPRHDGRVAKKEVVERKRADTRNAIASEHFISLENKKMPGCGVNVCVLSALPCKKDDASSQLGRLLTRLRI